MRLTVMRVEYPKLYGDSIEAFCKSTMTKRDVVAGMYPGDLVLLVCCPLAESEQIADYFDKNFPEIKYAIEVTPEEASATTEIVVKPDDVNLARESLRALGSKYWASMTLVRHGIPMLRANKAVQVAYDELNSAKQKG
ncbi:hypothetical protein E2P64_06440 [Candidatus Bathyarchaeota archaeon]|nr:hypothetical protein E2P64_06440 [Candidatus Bathyarchaeota archaeon]